MPYACMFQANFLKGSQVSSSHRLANHYSLLRYILDKQPGALDRRWSPASLVWQAQHFEHMDALVRGRSDTVTLRGLLGRAWSPLVPVYFSAASAALRADGCTFAWQVRRFDALGTVRANGHRRLTYLPPREVLSHTSSHTPHH